MLRTEILKLRQEGKTYSEIKDILQCSKSTISYHVSPEQRDKAKERTSQYRKNNLKTILNRKIYEFVVIERSKGKKKVREKPSFTVEDLINKFGDNPVCYLTGEPIDLLQSHTYSFDHIVPRLQGGDNSLSNLGLCTKEANHCKSFLTPEQLVEFCEKVISHLK